MNVVLIYNVRSGGEYRLSNLKALFRRYGVTIKYSFPIEQIDSKKLADLIGRGVVVAVVGGDGTLRSVARRLVDTKSQLLPLPGGTFNQFIRDIGASMDIEETLQNIDTAKVRAVDVAYVNDELFLNNSNLGMYPFSLVDQKKVKKVIGKWPAAIVSAGKQLSRFRRHNLVIDGKAVKSPFVFVGNGRYDITSVLIPTRVAMTKDTMTVMVALSATRRDFIRALTAVIVGKISKHNDFNVTTRRTMTIESKRAYLPVSLDGEVKRLVPPLMYRSKPKALMVVMVKASKVAR